MSVINVITKQGSNLIWQGLAAGKTVEFTRAVLGSGTPASTTVESLENMTALVTPFSSAYGSPVIASRRIDGRGNLVITATYSNSTASTQMLVKEIGVYAKIAGTSSDKLFSYLYLSESDTIPSSATLVTRIYDIPFAVASGTGENVTITVDPTSLVPSSATSVDPIDNTAGLIPITDSNGRLHFDTTGKAGYLWNAAKSSYYTADQLLNPNNLGDYVATSSSAGTMSAAQVISLSDLIAKVNQALTTTSTPTFAGLRVTGYIDGARFR